MAYDGHGNHDFSFVVSVNEGGSITHVHDTEDAEMLLIAFEFVTFFFYL